MVGQKRTLMQFLEYLQKQVVCIPYGCWIWTGTVNNGYYGKIKFKRKDWMFHRFMYELCIGPIPEGMLVCHTCDIERCGNPEHLFLGTHKDNTQDAINKGRFDPRRLGNLQIYKAMLKVH